MACCSNMELILYAPFRLPLNLDSQRFSVDPSAFSRLWKKAQKQIPPAMKLDLPEEDSNLRALPRFTTMSEPANNLRKYLLFSSDLGRNSKEVEDWLEDARQIADGEVFPENMRGQLQPCGEGELAGCEYSLGLMRLHVEVRPLTGETPALAFESLAPYVDEWTNQFVSQFVDHVFQKWLTPLLRALRSADRQIGENLLRSPANYQAIHDLRSELDSNAVAFKAGYEPVMWVGRMLCLAPGELENSACLESWAPALSAAREVTEPDSGTGVIISWGNGVIRRPPGCVISAAVHRAILRGQYFNAAFDLCSVNATHLYRHVGLQMEKPSAATARAVNRRASQLGGMIEMLVLDYQETLQGMQGADRSWLWEIRNQWGLDEVSDALQHKLALVRSRTHELNELRELRNQRAIELLLLFVGSIGVLDLGFSISRFADPDLGNGVVATALKWPPAPTAFLLSIALVTFLLGSAVFLRRHR